MKNLLSLTLIFSIIHTKDNLNIPVNTVVPLSLTCSPESNVIKQFLNQYKRPFTLLEINPETNKVHSFRLSNEYKNSVYVILNLNNQAYHPSENYLLQECESKNFDNIILLNKLFEIDELQHLSECEHFDIILNLNPKFISDNLWKKKLDSMCDMADHVIIKVPSNQLNSNYKFDEIKDYVINNIGIFSTLELENLYLIQSNKKKKLRRKTWLLPKRDVNKPEYLIESSFIEKKIIKPIYWPKKDIQEINWTAGINLLTFKMCNGIYPLSKSIKKCLYELQHVKHSDWMINNMIIQGNNLQFIDIDDVARRVGGPFKPDCVNQSKLESHCQIVDLYDPKKVEHYFWNKLIYVPFYNKYLKFYYSELLKTTSKIFEIDSGDADFMKMCLDYGTKIIHLNLLSKDLVEMKKKFSDENVIFVDNYILKSLTNGVTITHMIDLYGVPDFCNIHLKEEKVPNFLKDLKIPIKYIVFKFDIQSLNSLRESLEILNKLGYKKFNFSVRDIPVLILKKNQWTGAIKDWSDPETLLKEINLFSALDYEGAQLWGYIHASY